MLGLIGLKVGMTRYFNKEGLSIPVTLIQITENRVVQIKRQEKEGYNAVQLTFGEANVRWHREEALEKALIQEGQRLPKRNKFIKAPQRGHFEAHGSMPGKVLKEFRVSSEELALIESNRVLTVDHFRDIAVVDVTGTSKGKGFAGVIKRWNFRSQPASHGCSLSHRAPGSIGQNQTPGRVFKGKKMAGHLGCDRVTTKHLEVLDFDLDLSLLIVKGAVPGASGSLVYVKPSESKVSAKVA